MLQCGNYTAKLYNHTIPNKGNQVIDSKITINKKLKVRKLKDIHYNHQTLCILAKKGSIINITSPKRSGLQKIINFCH